MNKEKAKEIFESESLQDFCDLEKQKEVFAGGDDGALEKLVEDARAAKTKHYEGILGEVMAGRTCRRLVSKSFVARYDFEALYDDLYKGKGGKCFAVKHLDPAPGGYGDQFMYITEVYELDIDLKEKKITDEELLDLILNEGKKL